MSTLLCMGTPIPTAHGYVPIESLKIGDVLYSEFGNPIPITGIDIRFSELCRIQTQRVLFQQSVIDARNSLDIASGSTLPMKTYHDKDYASIEVQKAADSGVLEYIDGESVMKWSVKHGQGMSTSYVQPVGNIGYDSVSRLFTDKNYKIPDCFAYGSPLQKKQAIDCVKLGAVHDDMYFINNISSDALQQIAFMVESLGYNVYFVSDNEICFSDVQKFRDTYLNDISELGYSKRVYGIRTEGEIPFQAGLFHCIVDSL